MCCCFYFFATVPLHCCSLGSKIPARRLAPCYQSLSGTYSISTNEGNLKHWSDYMNRVRLCWACAACCWPWYSLLWTLPKYIVKSSQEINFTNKRMVALGKPVWRKKTKFISFSLRSLRSSRQAKPAAKPRGKIPPATFLMSFECRPLLTPWLEIFHNPISKSGVIRARPSVTKH